MRKDEGTRGDQEVVALAHRAVAGVPKSVAEGSDSGELLSAKRGERERGKRGEWERRAGRREWGGRDGTGRVDGGVKAELPRRFPATLMARDGEDGPDRWVRAPLSVRG